MKVVMTGSAADPASMAAAHPHQSAARGAGQALQGCRTTRSSIVIVRDMWLTGFDAPCLHTMYVDKPMRGHGLMQAIARVNRVFKDKPGGLVVDYLGLAARAEAGARHLHRERRDRADGARPGGGGRRRCWRSTRYAAASFHGFDRSNWTTGTPQQRLGLLPPAQEHILAQRGRQGPLLQGGRGRCRRPSRWRCRMTRRCASATTSPSSRRCRRASSKRAPGEARPQEELDHAIRQIVSRAVAPEGVIDIFAAAGLKKPDISILSDEFLAEVRGMPQRNLAVELLRKLLKGEISDAPAQEPGPGARLSPRCSSSRSGATRTGRSKRRRSSRS